MNGFIEYLADIVAEQPQLLDHHRRIKAAIQAQYRKQQQAVPATSQPPVKAEAMEAVEKVPVATQAIQMPSRLPVVVNRQIKLRNLDFDADHPDSRQREHRVLMAVARQLGRVPNLSEAFDILDQPDEYWNGKRRKRVMGTLCFIDKSFDASKCKRGGEKVALDLDKYTNTFKHRYRGRKVDLAKLSAFVVALEWSLAHQDRDDGSVTRSRIAKLSGLSNEMCKRLAQFVVRKGIFDCDLSDYRQDQARRWKIGKSLPGREWWRSRANASNCPVFPAKFVGGSSHPAPR